MAKNIIICCDGTWNTPDQTDGGGPAPTNVVKLFNAIAEKDAANVPQHKYYHPGVGTDGSWWDKVIGGGTGLGLDRNIMSAYRELCDHYEAGDRIYLFGFSRGAYTVRSLAGFISCCGILDLTKLSEGDAWKRIDLAYRRGYRQQTSQGLSQGWDFWVAPDPEKTTGIIHFLGVWDTVGALGIPEDMALLNLIDELHDYTFHDTELGKTVKFARHAVALDEMRASFQPTLWTNVAKNPNAKQVWFPGVHSDVGGGYRESGLSNAALKWMIEEVEGLPGTTPKLAFTDKMIKQVIANELDVLHDSADGVFSYLPTMPRSVPCFSPLAPDISDSARDRFQDPPIQQAPYRRSLKLQPPTKLEFDIFALHPWNATGLWLEAGQTYTFKATGEWLDRSISCGPAGTDDGNFQVGELVQIVGSALGVAETWFRKLTGNRDADFRGTKRHEEADWFCLMGCIANGGGVNSKLRVAPHETFVIGAGCSYKPKQSGYFYAYANDAWGFYGNNRGKVTLEVS